MASAHVHPMIANAAVADSQTTQRLSPADEFTSVVSWSWSNPSKRNARSRTTMIAVTAGVVVAAGLVAYGFSRSDDDRDPSRHATDDRRHPGAGGGLHDRCRRGDPWIRTDD